MAISRLGLFIFFVAFFPTSGLSKKHPRNIGNNVFTSFNEAFLPLFGNDHVIVQPDDPKSVQISLDRSSGSGFISKEFYIHGFFSASIKLPANYTAGVVATFYASNNIQYPDNHDEIDFEFLGNIKSKDWLLQTNVYGNGSTSKGREERYTLWFDPSQDFHTYSILWTSKSIIFYVDDVPIRETQRVEAMGGDYPAKPMSLFATIWDGSDWATSGGKYKVDYNFSPFVARYSDLELVGCTIDPTQKQPKCNFPVEQFAGLTKTDKTVMKNHRTKYMIYSYCYDKSRYPVPLPECVPWQW
ncbi:hypothetical protein Tsubulata_010363 [Turnera subulata]|uniref:Xyloglucan endotransglucosylase/hydrolase n=1 Tax=Turnera subulata TaxID=218843 RepID=A0A9Q0F635_9ROSI|nr:hypothetical protein Tsubulata_010363 [Turnera subulata]